MSPRTENPNNRKLVVAIGMLDSVHFARWLELFSDQPVDFVLFPSSPNRRVHSLISELIDGNEGARYRVPYRLDRLAPVIWLIDRVLGNNLRGELLARLIMRGKPDFVHALEIQHAGYIALRAFRKLREVERPHFLVTNYGSDIFWFGRVQKHRARIQELLSLATHYSAECQRDVELAREFGFRGVVLPVFPNSGGLPAEVLVGAKPGVERNSIAVKGYQGWAGRAILALRALRSIRQSLEHYIFEVYSANFTTWLYCSYLRHFFGMKIVVYKKRELSHADLLSVFERSLVYVGISKTDGISTSMLEAMAMGAVPVQTSTACCDEWFRDTGVSIERLELEEIARGVLQAVLLATETDAPQRNREIVRERASREGITPQALEFYEL